MEKNNIKINFIIINYNTCNLTLRCINNILSLVKDIEFNVIVVDNCSKDDSIIELKKVKEITLIENNINKGFSTACNQAINLSKESEYYFFVNSDTVPNENAIYGMIKYLDDNNDVAAIGPKLLNNDGSMQNSFANYPSFLTEFFGTRILSIFNSKKYFNKSLKIDTEIEVDSLIGAFILIRGNILKQINYFDERFFFFLEETDLFKRIKDTGKKIIYSPKYSVMHLQGASAGKNPIWSRHIFWRSKYQYLLKWEGFLKFFIIYLKNMLFFHLKVLFYFIVFALTLFLNRKLKEKFLVAYHLTKNHFLGFPPYIKYDVSSKHYKNFSMQYMNSYKNIFDNYIIQKLLNNLNKKFDEESFEKILKDYMLKNNFEIIRNNQKNINLKTVLNNSLICYNSLVPVRQIIAILKSEKRHSFFISFRTNNRLISLRDIFNSKVNLISNNAKINLIKSAITYIRGLHNKSMYIDNLNIDDLLVTDVFHEEITGKIILTNIHKLKFGFFSTLLHKDSNINYLFGLLNKIIKLND